MRDYTIDFQKGILVVMMIYAHVLQFLCNLSTYTTLKYISTFVNIIAFSCFLFCFGYTTKLSYLQKEFFKALPNMSKTFLRTLICFWFSGLAHRLIVKNFPYDLKTFLKVILLFDIPGYSEFLISFALYTLLTICFFKILKSSNKKLLFLLSLLFLFMCFIPYEKITSTHLGILIGGKGAAFFPVIQYMPFFTAGILYNESKSSNIILAISAVISGIVSIIWVANNQALPSRFPPHLVWILLSALPILVFTIFSRYLKLFASAKSKILNQICIFFEQIGKQSLYYLLGSNLIIFALDRSLRDDNVGFGIITTIVIVAFLYFIIWLIARPNKSPSK